MRTVPAELATLQKASTRWPHVVVTFLKGITTYTYTNADNRILYIHHLEQPYDHTAMMILVNNTRDLPDLIGYTCLIDYGNKTSATGTTYLPTPSGPAPLWVNYQQHISKPSGSKVYTVLLLSGVWKELGETNLIGSLIAPTTYPWWDEDYTGTAHTAYDIIEKILDTEGFNLLPLGIHDDSIIDTLTPDLKINKTSFETPRDVIYRLLSMTKCFLRAERSSAYSQCQLEPDTYDIKITEPFSALPFSNWTITGNYGLGNYYVSPSKSLRLDYTSLDAQAMLNEGVSGCITEGEIETWILTDYWYVGIKLIFRSQSTTGATNCYQLMWWATSEPLASGWSLFWVDAAGTLYQVGVAAADGFPDFQTWYKYKVTWYEGCTGGESGDPCTVVVLRKWDTDHWDILKTWTDTNRRNYNSSTNLVGVGKYGNAQYSYLYFDDTIIRNATRVAQTAFAQFRVIYPPAWTDYHATYTSDKPDATYHQFKEFEWHEQLFLPNIVQVSYGEVTDEMSPDFGDFIGTGQYAINKDTYNNGYHDVYMYQGASTLTLLADANTRAEVIAKRRWMESILGRVRVPHDCGLELYDYIQVRDKRGVANYVDYPNARWNSDIAKLCVVGSIEHIFAPGVYDMVITLNGISTAPPAYAYDVAKKKPPINIPLPWTGWFELPDSLPVSNATPFKPILNPVNYGGRYAVWNAMLDLATGGGGIRRDITEQAIEWAQEVAPQYPKPPGFDECLQGIVQHDSAPQLGPFVSELISPTIDPSARQPGESLVAWMNRVNNPNR